MALTGSIPDELGGCERLNRVILGQNQLTGSIPDSLAGLKSLNVLDLSDNKLSGQVPENLGANKTGLREVHLFKNRLEGVLPPSFDDCFRLSELRILNSGLKAPLPPRLRERALSFKDKAFRNVYSPWWFYTESPTDRGVASLLVRLGGMEKTLSGFERYFGRDAPLPDFTEARPATLVLDDDRFLPTHTRTGWA